VVVKTRRRPKGEGSIVQRKDGIWQFSLDLGKGDDGKRQRIYFYAGSRADLLRKVADQRARSNGSIRPRAKGTVGEWVSRWLENDVKPNRARNTYAQYETLWRIHVKESLGFLSLNKLDVQHVENLYRSLRKKHVSSSTLFHIAKVMSRAIAVAIRRQAYFKPNPFTIVEKPAPRPKETQVLSVKEARRFLKEAQGTRYEALWILLLTAGLRLGEALALEWRDIDFEKRLLSVRQGLTDVEGVVKPDDPLKTPGSRRPVELGSLAVQALRRRKVAAKKEPHRSPFIFTKEDGSHPRRWDLRKYEFKPICDAAGTQGLRIGGLRHSMTSLALRHGVPIKTVSSRLGHSTTRMTLDRYGHILPGADRGAAGAIDALLRVPNRRQKATPRGNPVGRESKNRL
jgi:integrase